MLRPRNLLVFALALLAAGSLTYAWMVAHDLADLRSQLADSRKGAGELQKKLFEAEAKAARPAPVETAAALAPAGPEEGAPPPPPGEGPQRNRGGQNRGAFMAEMMADPKVAPLLMEQRKRALDQRYAALFRKLNLPPEQLEKLKTMLAEKELSRADAMALARSQGMGRDDIRAMTQQADADSDAQIKSLLGDARYAQLSSYEQTGSQRTAVNQFAERLSYGAVPLTAEQNDQLVQILAANPLSGVGGRNNLPEFATLAGGFAGRGPDMGGVAMGGRGPSEEDIAKYTTAKAARDAAVLQQAAAVLAPAQVQALQQMQQEENNQIQLMQIMRARAQQEFGNQAQGRGNRRNGGGGGGGG